MTSIKTDTKFWIIGTLTSVCILMFGGLIENVRQGPAGIAHAVLVERVDNFEVEVRDDLQELKERTKEILTLVKSR